MQAQANNRSRTPDTFPANQEEQVQADLIRIIFKQSYIGIIVSVGTAAAMVFILWSEVDHIRLGWWLSSLLLVAGLHAVLVHQYHFHTVPAQQSRLWGRWYIAGMTLMGVLWGASMAFIYPYSSLSHQLCIALLLSGMVGMTGRLYAVVPLAVAAFSMPVFLAWIVRFVTYRDAIHLVTAGLAALYMAIMILSSHHVARIRRQLLIARYNLANRVTERSRELKETNAYLQTEIKERKDIEERLRQERDRLEVITTTIGAGLAVISKKHRVLWTNRIYKELFGDDLGKHCFQHRFHNSEESEVCGPRMIFEQGSEKIVHERKYVDPDGNTRWFQIISTPIRNAQGRIRAALLMVIPITERKEAEEAQHRMSETLEEARKTEAIATLAGGIAHQFNNALAVIAGNVELMEYDYRDDLHIKDFARPVVGATQKMTELTSQLLAYAKGGKYKELLNDLSEVVEKALSFIEHTVPKTILIQKELPPDLPRTKIDTTQIQMAVSSVVSNAMEAMEKEGRIKIRCGSVTVTESNRSGYDDIPSGRYVSLTTADNGVGMDALTLKRIFDPFFTTKFAGRGLGMAAVYGIIKNHGGHIHVSSQPEEGTEVRIYLPAVEETAAPLSEADGQPVEGSGTVLMVEDDVDVIDVNQVWIKRIGYQVVIATTGHEALEIICHTNIQIDAVLLDMILPDMNGAAVYPFIKKHRPGVKVIVTSGYDKDDAIQELLDAGADGFIQKPFTLSRISNLLSRVLPPDKAPGSDDQPAQLGN